MITTLKEEGRQVDHRRDGKIIRLSRRSEMSKGRIITVHVADDKVYITSIFST
jgi:hypothetical protein